MDETRALILTALAVGASTRGLDALKDDVKERVTAACAKLRGLAGKRVVGRPHGEVALAEFESAPQKREDLLGAELIKASAAQDDDLVAAAKAWMGLIDRSGAKSGKRNVTIKDSKGSRSTLTTFRPIGSSRDG